MSKLHCRQSYSVCLMFSTLLIGLTLLAGCEQKSTSTINTDLANKTVPKQAVDFTLPDLAGKPHSLAGYLDKGPVLLVFFTTWCPYCVKEIPTLKQIYREYGSKGLQLVAINAGLVDSLENAKRYALQHRLPYPILYDTDALVSAKYNVQAVPQMYVIQQNGKIIKSSKHVPQETISKVSSAIRQARTDLVLGDAQAPVTLIEYGSLTCDYCIRFHREVLPQVKSHYIDPGKVRFIYRHFPTSQAAMHGAIAAQCAGNQYYEMLDRLYFSLDWSQATNIESALIQQATSLGMEATSFRTCLNNNRQANDIISEQRTASEAYGVNGTPTFIINGEVVQGQKTFDAMSVLIDKALLNQVSLELQRQNINIQAND